MEAITKSSIFSSSQITCQHVIELVMSKITYSQYERTSTYIFFKDGRV